MSPTQNLFWLRIKWRLVVIDKALPRGWKVALAAVIAVGIGAHYFSMSLSTPLWLLTKLLLGGFVGLVVDWMGFPAGRPHFFEAGSEAQQAAWRRRSVVIAGCVVAAGVSA
jgi:hypothetical protein